MEARDLSAERALFRPARLCRADEPGARLLRSRSSGCSASRCRAARQLIRVLYCEIGRLLSHLLNVTTQAMDVGALTPPLWGFEEREKLMVFYERASRLAHARRLFPPRRRPPGSAAQADRRHRRLLRSVPEGRATISKSCSPSNRIFKQRNVDIGVVKLADAWAWGFSGVMVRGSGAPGTCASRSPTSATRRWNSTFPSARTATATTAICIRMEEMRQSVQHHEAVLREAAIRPSGEGPVGHRRRQDRAAASAAR